jgi:hypothetical protein
MLTAMTLSPPPIETTLPSTLPINSPPTVGVLSSGDERARSRKAASRERESHW